MNENYDQDKTNAAVTAHAATLAAQREFQVKTFKVGDRELHLLPTDFKVHDYENLLPAPHRLKGAIYVEDVDSFGKAVARFDKGSRIVHVNKGDLRFLAILNAAIGENAAWEDHRVTFQLEHHRDLKAWQAACKDGMNQVTFMEFLEDRIDDVTQKPATQSGGAPEGPTQSALLGVAGDLRVTSEARFTSTKNLHNGNFVFETSEQGKATVEVPEVFYIGLPIFEGSKEPYLIPIRLRYRIDNGALRFFLKMVGFDRIFESAWTQLEKDVIAVIPTDVPYLRVPSKAAIARAIQVGQAT